MEKKVNMLEKKIQELQENEVLLKEKHVYENEEKNKNLQNAEVEVEAIKKK